MKNNRVSLLWLDSKFLFLNRYVAPLKSLDELLFLEHLFFETHFSLPDVASNACVLAFARDVLHHASIVILVLVPNANMCLVLHVIIMRHQT